MTRQEQLRLLWFSLVMVAPFLWFSMMAFRTFRVPASGWPGLMLGWVSMMSGIVLSMWMGRHGSFDLVRWLAGALLAVCSIALYDWSRRVITGRGFYSVLSGTVPEGVCAEGPYRYVRHPVYASYLLAFLGLLVAFPGVETGIVFAANLVFFAYAAAAEERSISQSALAQPYAAYRRTAGMFLPRVGR